MKTAIYIILSVIQCGLIYQIILSPTSLKWWELIIPIVAVLVWRLVVKLMENVSFKAFTGIMFGCLISVIIWLLIYLLLR